MAVTLMDGARKFSTKEASMANETAVRSNTEVVREYTQRVFNEHAPDLASEYLSPGMKWRGGLLGTIEGPQNVTGMLRGFIGALPGHARGGAGHRRGGRHRRVRYVVEATHEGNLLGIAPTGRRLRWDAVDIYRLADGMIVEEWAADDMAAILYQMGAYTPPWL
jgi:SnoaL-like polyketide cyclase